MFARTERLMLRPGWAEDAPALARAIGHEAVVRNLSRPPWPYCLGDAAAFLALPSAPATANLLIFDDPAGRPRLVGGIGIDALDGAGGREFGYWLTPAAWGRGYATEAGRAVLQLARHALGLRRVQSGYFLDNPASGRVLAKLGFRATGRVVAQFCAARGADVPCARVELDLADAPCGEPSMPLAA